MMLLGDALIRTPTTGLLTPVSGFSRAAVPLALVPIRLPMIRLPVVLELKM